MHEKCQVILTDDQAFLRKGLTTILSQDRMFRIMGEAGDGLELLGLLDRGTVPDVLILDLSMPLLSGFDALRLIRRAGYSFKILVLTMHNEPEVLCQVLLAGANGYMLKDEIVTELIPALHHILKERLYLSPSIIKVLPKTCWIKTGTEGDLAPFSAAHCRKDSAESASRLI